MLNEVVQWLALMALAFLLLGLYRQLAVLLGYLGQSVHSDAGPPVGSRLPRAVVAALRLDGDTNPVVFVSPSCRACQRLLSDLGHRSPESGPVALLYHDNAPPAFARALAGISGVYPVAVTAEDWAKSRVYTTPLVCQIDHDGRVLEKRVSHKLEQDVTG